MAYEAHPETHRPAAASGRAARFLLLGAALALPVLGTFAEAGLGFPGAANLALTLLGLAALLLLVSLRRPASYPAARR